jgi:hypothetical protein
MLLLLFRITCLVFAFFFILDMFFLSGSEVFKDAGFGKQFRYFTLWSLLANFIAVLFLSLSLKFTIFNQTKPFIAISSMMGLFTIILYWGLFFIDPNLVNYAGERLDFFREIYLHLVGPALLFFDALIFKKAFSNFSRILPFAFVINFGYFTWLETLVEPNSDFPVGKITSGLPYPFMNDMLLEHRLIFMVVCFLSGALFIWILTKFQKKYVNFSI